MPWIPAAEKQVAARQRDRVANVYSPKPSVQAGMEGFLVEKICRQSESGGVSPHPLLEGADKPRVMKGDDFSKAAEVLLYAPV